MQGSAMHLSISPLGQSLDSCQVEPQPAQCKKEE